MTKEATLERLVAAPIKGSNPLRSDVIEGVFERDPEVGKSFSFFAAPIDPNASFRWTTTSPVKEIYDFSYNEEDPFVD